MVFVAALFAPVTASADQVCLDFDLGDSLWDASGPGDAGGGCTPGQADECANAPNNLGPTWICALDGTHCTQEKSEDYGRNDGSDLHPFPAKRVLARVLDNGYYQMHPDNPGPGVRWGWDMLDENGCTANTVDLSNLSDGTIRIEYEFWSENPYDSVATKRNFVLAYTCDGQLHADDFSYCTQPRQVVAGVAPEPSGAPTYATQDLSAAEDPDLAQAATQQAQAHYPFWSITFAESRHGQNAYTAATREHVYVFADNSSAIGPSAISHADRSVGHHPTVYMQGRTWHGKFVAAHEYGHAITQVILIANFGQAWVDDSAGGPEHTLDSVEFQSVASSEGLADFYAVAVWNDLDDLHLPMAYFSPAAEDTDPTAVYLEYKAATTTDSACAQQGGCPAGEANETDWMWAEREFVASAVVHGGDPGFVAFQALAMLSVFANAGNCTQYQSATTCGNAGCFWSTLVMPERCVGWPPNNDYGDDSAWWQGFDQEMQTFLGGDYTDWSNSASQLEIAQ